ncbi:TPA: hypothetical protein ACH3X3_005760 [Trebouxia sp. C0006]
MNSTLPPQSIADQPSTSGRSSYAPAAALSEARYWSPSTPPAAEWREHWQNVIPELTELARKRKRPPDAVIMRASQLDAARLDTELSAMLKEQFMKIFSYFQPRLISAFQPELTLILELLIFRFSVWAGKPTPGSALMNLRYRDERQINIKSRKSTGSSQGALQNSSCQPNGVNSRTEVGGRTGVEGPGLSRWQRGLWGLGTVLMQYAWSRLDQVAAAQHWGDFDSSPGVQRAWRVLRSCETALSLASLLNFLVFLQQGKYRSLLERVLRARLVYQRANMARAISFEYLNRQLVWHELSELLLFVLPLISVTWLKRMIVNRWPSLRAATAKHLQRASGLESQLSGADNKTLPGPCAICAAHEITVPFCAVPCKHTFCYYCLRTNCEADHHFTCPTCSTRVDAMKRWYPADLASQT